MGLIGKLRHLLDPAKRLPAQIESERQKYNDSRGFPLTSEALLSQVDQAKLDALQASHGIADPGIRIEKYLEADKWLATNIRRAINMGLDFQPPRRVLDLGCGAGYFLYVCRKLGHDVLGLDMEDPGAAWYLDMLEIFGVGRITSQIDPFTPLPDFGEKFDYVTAFMVCFNRHIQENVWKRDEWTFFLDDLDTRLNPGAIVWLELNPGVNGQHYTADLKALFESRAAIVDGKRLVWGMDPEQYRALLDEGRRETAHVKKSAVAAV